MRTDTSSNSKLDFSGVRVTSAGILRVDEGRGMEPFVPREQVLHIHVRHGFQAPRPLAQLTVGMLLAATSLYILLGAVSDLWEGNGISLKKSGAVVFLGAIGAWFAVDGVRKGPYLEVTTEKGVEKFPLVGAYDRIAFEEFMGKAHKEFGYEIQSTGEERR